MAYSDIPDPMGRRKAEHLRIAAEEDIETSRAPGWDDVHLVHDALPATDAAKIDLSTRLLGHSLALPLLIAGMGGGHTGAGARDRHARRAPSASGHRHRGRQPAGRAPRPEPPAHVRGRPRARAEG